MHLVSHTHDIVMVLSRGISPLNWNTLWLRQPKVSVANDLDFSPLKCRPLHATIVSELKNREVIPEVLSEEHLPDLLDLLCDVAHKWEEIATYLSLRPGVIAVIKDENTNAQKKLLEVIRRWLNRTSPAPTALALIDVLRKRFIGEKKVALEIERTFYPQSSSKLKHTRPTRQNTLFPR